MSRAMQRDPIVDECYEIVCAWHNMLDLVNKSCRTYMQAIHLWWWMRTFHTSTKARLQALKMRARESGFADESYYVFFSQVPCELDASFEELVKTFERKVDECGPVIDNSLNDITEVISLIHDILHGNEAENISQHHAEKSFVSGSLLCVPSLRLSVTGLSKRHPDVERVLKLGKDLIVHTLEQCFASAAEKGDVMKWAPTIPQEGRRRGLVADRTMTINVCDVRIGRVIHVTQVCVRLLVPNPFGTIAYLLSRDLRVRYYDPVQDQLQWIATAWVPPLMNSGP